MLFPIKLFFLLFLWWVGLPLEKFHPIIILEITIFLHPSSLYWLKLLCPLNYIPTFHSLLSALLHLLCINNLGSTHRRNVLLHLSSIHMDLVPFSNCILLDWKDSFHMCRSMVKVFLCLLNKTKNQPWK